MRKDVTTIHIHVKDVVDVTRRKKNEETIVSIIDACNGWVYVCD